MTASDLMQHLLDSYGFPPGTTFDQWFFLDEEQIMTVGDYISWMKG